MSALILASDGIESVRRYFGWDARVIRRASQGSPAQGLELGTGRIVELDPEHAS
jgi:hypothetical protein